MNCPIHNRPLICPQCEGAKGGAKRARRHSKKELAKWARLGALATNKKRKRRRKEA